MVVGGLVKPWEDDGTYFELFWENVLYIAENFLERNISVVLDYIVYPEHTQKIINRFKEKSVNIKYIVLMADKNTILERDALRNVECRMCQRAVKLLEEFQKIGIEDKFIIDTTSFDKEEILNVIMTDKRFIL